MMREKSLGIKGENHYYPDSSVITANKETLKMKIQAETQQAALARQAGNEGDSQAVAGRDKAAKPLQKRDVVELSSALELEGSGEMERLQAERVESIKSQVAAGTYRVDGRLVAEKMLSGALGI